MQIKVRYKTISALYYMMCMCLLTLYQLLEMRSMEKGVEQYPGSGIITCFVLMVFAGSLLKFYIIPNYKAYKPNTTMILYLVYLLWIFVPIMLNKIADKPMDQILILVRQTLPIFSLLLTYNFILNHRDSKLFGWYFCITSVLFALQYFMIMLELLPEIAHIIVSYYTLYMLPLILLTCGKKRSIIFVIFTLLVLITSVKRGGIVAMGGGLVTYAIAYMIASPKVKATTIIVGLAVMAVLVGMFLYMADSMDSGRNNILDRFENADKDGGSQRTVTWAKSYQLIENSEPLPLIFGHGWNAVEHDSQMGWSAHNDFLEVTYDYGIIGLVLYVLAVLSLCAKVLRHLHRKTPYALVLSMFFAIYFMMSMASHVIIYSWANVVMLTISYISAREKYDEIHEPDHI